MMDFTTQKEINILGYSGQYLALIFESLTANRFTGVVNIVLNDGKKRSEAEFETNIEYKVLDYTDVKVTPETGFVFCSNKPTTKKFLFDFFLKNWKIERAQYASFWHPSSVVASSAKIDPGFYMDPLSVISPYSKIGFGVSVNRNCSVGHHNTINNFCSIHPGANLAGNVVLSENVTVGPGTTVFSKVHVGKNTIIGGGSVVTKNLPENVLAFGNPCKVIKSI